MSDGAITKVIEKSATVVHVVIGGYEVQANICRRYKEGDIPPVGQRILLALDAYDLAQKSNHPPTLDDIAIAFSVSLGALTEFREYSLRK